MIRHLEKLRQAFFKTSRFRLFWWGFGSVSLCLFVVLQSLGLATCLQAFLVFVLVLWGLPTLGYALFWLWRKVASRISVRLFISYLLVGVLPFPLLVALAGLGAYVLLGQYVSEDFGGVTRRVEDELVHHVEKALDERNDDATTAVGQEATWPRDLAPLAPHVEWASFSSAGVSRSAEAWELPKPDWLGEGTTQGAFKLDGKPFLAVAARRGEHVVTAFLPLDVDTARVLSGILWYRVFFEEDKDIDLGSELRRPEVGPPEATPRSWWQRQWLVFFRVSPEPRDWRSGEMLEGEDGFAVLLRTSPHNALTDLFQIPPEVGRAIWGLFLGICCFFSLVYLGAVGVAGIQIASITRAVSRLSRGSREVEAGKLEVRIPVHRRDQLGDLAMSFNHMIEAVENMLAEVAEKERLKNELELAREIQQSLLPARVLSHGGLEVYTYFRPAAEVGGDYFDLFPLDDGRLLVAAGDVAGHGLSTGLLMAMVKSAVATLVLEGHRGVELLERLNRFMRQQPREHRMLTLALAEIDREEGTVEIANAAHPPLFMCGTGLCGMGVREIELPALPVGFKWRRRPPVVRLDLEPGTRIVFYSDGLVEAIDAADEPFGYDRLQALLEHHLDTPTEALLDVLLEGLERHTGGRPLEDDLTLLVVDCGAGQGA